ncbi:DUF397 domain-containing protein [Nocardiopsis lambiniae]|uniref:DUF397 domain-containing protein n=1 Tax=Nocardiopsis lambiniae TaxID=3075539 RepID=A0ABU2M7L1_9ACTN|nr:DUF397 domain-containing protein [Nocardiopsis sp. DSM 44743]MDT0328226.1 DUF397 domain-containing protein [Nocardiopsis sp. DSM 44743]
MSNPVRAWHTSSYTGGNDPNCVEVAEGAMTAVRDTQNRELGHLEFSSAEWASLVDTLKSHS